MNPTTSTFPENCKKALGDLSKSPTFAMSLGAKELFHTNFLAYLLENQSKDKKLQCIQSKLKNLLFDHNGIGRVITWREKYSLDLVILPAPVIDKNEQEVDVLGLDVINLISNDPFTIAVVIEVKLKSIPTQQQLDEYDLKLSSGITFELDDTDQQTCDDINYKFMRLCGDVKTPSIKILSEKNKKAKEIEFTGKIRRILLGPTDPEKTNWDYISWKNVVNCLVIESNKREILQYKETELLQSLICDYRKSLESILEILRFTNDHVDKAITNCITTYQSYYDAITHKDFRDLRIHDLVGKYANNVLEGKVFINLQTIFGTCEFNISNRTFTLNSYTFFSNQQPGVTFEWLCKEGKLEVSFGVTIQGNDYRHFISVNGKNDVDRNSVLDKLEIILGNDDDNNDWFLCHKNKSLDLGKKELVNKTTTFFVFTESKFRYSKATVNSLKLSKLSKAVFISLNKAKIMVTKRCSDLCPQLLEFFKEPSS
jgi:hypothetical protein